MILRKLTQTNLLVLLPEQLHLEEILENLSTKIDVPKDIELSEELEKELDEDEDLIKSLF